MEDNERNYIISTHSPVMMNAVPADRIINIVQGERGSFKGSDQQSVGPILLSLGYKNSDFLLYDRLILGEGKTEAAVLPIFLKTCGLSPVLVDRTGFPITEGADSSSSIKKQTIILKYEKMLQELEMASIPRVYLRDGDASPEERTTLQGTNQPADGKPVQIRFLPFSEIENYLLVPEAIAAAVRTLKDLSGTSEEKPQTAEVKTVLDGFIASDDNKLFPHGRGNDPWVSVKGSLVLRKIFENYELRYEKELAATLIAQHITLQNQPALKDIADLVADLFTKSS